MIARQRHVVLVLQRLEDDATMHGHALHPLEVKDLNRGRAYLADIAQRHNVPVFDNVKACVEHIIETEAARKS